MIEAMMASPTGMIHEDQELLSLPGELVAHAFGLDSRSLISS